MLTLFALPSNGALTFEVTNQVTALSAVAAWVRGTINIGLTELTNIALAALALIFVVQI